MAEISKIRLPSGTEYDLKDAVAREIAGGGLQFRGVTSTELTDGSAAATYVVGGETLTAANGDMVVYSSKEFVFSTSDNKWHELGDNTSLRALAYKDDAEATYTPGGTVGTPTISLATPGATDTIHNPTAKTMAKQIVAAAPGESAPANAVTYYSVSGETLSLYQLGYNTEPSITTADVTVKTGDGAYESSQPSWTGTQATITVS